MLPGLLTSFSNGTFLSLSLSLGPWLKGVDILDPTSLGVRNEAPEAMSPGSQASLLAALLGHFIVTHDAFLLTPNIQLSAVSSDGKKNPSRVRSNTKFLSGVAYKTWVLKNK